MTAADTTPMESASVVLMERGTEAKKNAVVFSPELLAMYYSRLFPFHLMFDWLSYDPTGTSSEKLFARREFSFTIDVGGEEIYIRYQSYTKQADFQAAILQRKPMKIDIGAVFSHPPKDHKAIAHGFQTEQRELVFDIDLTDYDEVRQCGCAGANICTRCWQMMTMAVKVMEKGLREDFGFKHIAWFYSGRRGVHAWVCDEKARTLSNEARSAVASYFEVNLGTDKNKNITLPQPLHPMMQRALSILEPMFIKNIISKSGHGILATEQQWTALLKTIPSSADAVRENLEKKWRKIDSTPVEKWEELKQHLEVFVSKAKGGGKAAKTMSTMEKNKLESWAAETVFRHTYPRLDINVSKMQNHLLKSPFCVHPKTGRVCIPIQADKIDSFDPFSVPTLPELMDELDSHNKADPNCKITHDWQKTRLKESFEPFIRNFLEPMLKDLRKQQREIAEERAAKAGDF